MNWNVRLMLGGALRRGTERQTVQRGHSSARVLVRSSGGAPIILGRHVTSPRPARMTTSPSSSTAAGIDSASLTSSYRRAPGRRSLGWRTVATTREGVGAGHHVPYVDFA